MYVPTPLKPGPCVQSVPGVNVLCELSPERAWWGMAPTTQPPQEPNSGEGGGTLAPGSRTTGFAFRLFGSFATWKRGGQFSGTTS